MKKKKAAMPLLTLNALILLLKQAEDALKNHNFGLAKVWVKDYFDKLPKGQGDTTLTKAFNRAISQKNAELLRVTVDAEIERLDTIKIKKLRNKIIKKAKS